MNENPSIDNNTESQPKKCINLDWLEVYCLEYSDNITRDADFYKKDGWQVKARDYGTPQYKEMFTLYKQGKPFLEIRRNPYSIKEQQGIFLHNACHIRLCNFTLYKLEPVNELRIFLEHYKYVYQSISRVDICCDFVEFDHPEIKDPQKFLNDYMKERFFKTNNSQIAPHGKEKKFKRSWNSIKWGNPSAPISTKMYDKTLELQTESKDKFYIRKAWVRAGLCDLQKVSYTYKDNRTGREEQRSKMVVVKKGTSVKAEIPIEQAEQIKVWRVEFSLKTEGRKWIISKEQFTKEVFEESTDPTKQGEESQETKSLCVEMNLDFFDNRDKLHYQFLLLSTYLFKFGVPEFTRTGKAKQKCRCKVIMPFSTADLHETYKPTKVTYEDNPSRFEKIIINRLLNVAEEVKDIAPEHAERMKKAAVSLSISHGGFWHNEKKVEKIEKAVENANNKLTLTSQEYKYSPTEHQRFIKLQMLKLQKQYAYWQKYLWEHLPSLEECALIELPF